MMRLKTGTFEQVAILHITRLVKIQTSVSRIDSNVCYSPLML